MKNTAIVILAAGRSRRMKSGLPKPLHPICGRPMLEYVLDLAKGLKPQETVVVLGHKAEEVGKILPAGVKTVIQKKLIGTADALKEALSALKGFKGTLLMLYADIPLLKKETLSDMLKYHQESESCATLLIAQVNDPSGYGRILRDRCSSISGIVEDKEADDFEKEIKEINTGIICFDKGEIASVLKYIKPDNRKKEYYLTDAVELLYRKGALVSGYKLKDINEALGVDSRERLAQANTVMQKRINSRLMESGVTIVAPEAAFISYGVKIGRDTIIHPFTVIDKNVVVGRRCSVGPFTHLREGVKLGDDILAGNFLEIVRSKIGRGSFIKHFSYIGDSSIGRDVNIGAGTVTANFDGRRKNKVVVQDGAFIGSDTVLVAPVKIGKKARTGAGCVVVKNADVPDGVTVMGVPAVQKVSRP